MDKVSFFFYRCDAKRKGSAGHQGTERKRVLVSTYSTVDKCHTFKYNTKSLESEIMHFCWRFIFSHTIQIWVKFQNIVVCRRFSYCKLYNIHYDIFDAATSGLTLQFSNCIQLTCFLALQLKCQWLTFFLTTKASRNLNLYKESLKRNDIDIDQHIIVRGIAAFFFFNWINCSHIDIQTNIIQLIPLLPLYIRAFPQVLRLESALYRRCLLIDQLVVLLQSFDPDFQLDSHPHYRYYLTDDEMRVPQLSYGMHW